MALFAAAVVVLAGCGDRVAGTAMPQQGDATAPPSTTTDSGPGADTAPHAEVSPAPPDVTSADDLREVDDSTDIDPCSLMPMDVLARGGEFSEPELRNGACWSTEPSTDSQVSIEFSRDTVHDTVQRHGLQLGTIHGRAAAELDMSGQDLGCIVIMEMNPEEVVMVLFDGPAPECQYAAAVATGVETRISQG
ncbi:hypothetical protein BJF85_07270 [Saccharomonospora sp. CUA-673]|nr:hypothetical protein BJF85_07270 [Saccharomonospora sp. CUA-673]